MPYSRYRPAFNSKALAQISRMSELVICSRENELGGMPKDVALKSNDLPDYDKIRKKRFHFSDFNI
jgi:hypothetical protein